MLRETWLEMAHLQWMRHPSGLPHAKADPLLVSCRALEKLHNNITQLGYLLSPMAEARYNYMDSFWRDRHTTKGELGWYGGECHGMQNINIEIGYNVVQ